jgi:hypothetical protein
LENGLVQYDFQEETLSKSGDDKVSYSKADIVRILRDLNMIVVSLDRIGSASNDGDHATESQWTNEFINDWQVAPRLAEARAILSDAFSYDLGPDDKDELERLMGEIPKWSSTNRKPPQ